MKLSIILPCYNEAKNIPLILSRFREVLARDDVEVILVNNGSGDDSQEVLERLIPQYNFARTVEVEINQGYGFGILSGLKVATGEYLAWTHADIQMDSYDVIRGFSLIEKSAQPQKIFVKGRRIGRPFSDRIFTFGMSVFETLYMGTQLNDINAQPNIFHRSFFECWSNPPYDFSLDLYAFYMARSLNLSVLRFPVVVRKRLYGHSHWNFGWKSRYKFIKRTVEFSIKLKKGLR